MASFATTHSNHVCLAASSARMIGQLRPNKARARVFACKLFCPQIRHGCIGTRDSDSLPRSGDPTPRRLSSLKQPRRLLRMWNDAAAPLSTGCP